MPRLIFLSFIVLAYFTFANICKTKDTYRPFALYTVHCLHDLQFMKTRYSLMHKKTEKSISRFFIYKKFKKQFYFFTCILTGYFFNESPKEFWKNSNFENMRANFLRRCLNSRWQNSLEIMHFQA